MPLTLWADDGLPPLSIEQTGARIDYSFFLPLPSEESHLVSLKEIAAEKGSKTTIDYQIIISGNTSDFYVLNGKSRYSGSPAKISGLATGNQTLYIYQDGYKPLTMKLTVREGVQYQIVVELAALSGAIMVKADRECQVLEIDGNSVFANTTIVLPEGSHRVLVRSFGWQDYDQSVTVREGMLATVDVHFVPARFNIHSPQVSRVRFRPQNPGSFGTSNLSFQATSAGNGQLAIMDPQGELVRTHDFPTFSTWTQSFTWDGRDKDGTLLPDGDYSWKVQAMGADNPDGPSLELNGRVTIDSSSFIKFRSSANGPSGLPLVSDSYTLPGGAFQTAARLDYLPEGMASGNSDAVQVALGIRFGIIKNLEISFNGLGTLALGTTSQGATLIGANLAWAFLPLPDNRAGLSLAAPDLGLSLNLGGAFPLNDSTAYPMRAWSSGLVSGGRLGLAAQLRFGLLSLLLEPVMYLAPWAPNIATAPVPSKPTSLPDARATFFGSLNGGVYLDLDWLLFGISAALHTDGNLVPGLPVPLSAYLQIMPLDGLTIGLSAMLPISEKLPALPQMGLSVGLVN